MGMMFAVAANPRVTFSAQSLVLYIVVPVRICGGYGSSLPARAVAHSELLPFIGIVPFPSTAMGVVGAVGAATPKLRSLRGTIFGGPKYSAWAVTRAHFGENIPPELSHGNFLSSAQSTYIPPPASFLLVLLPPRLPRVLPLAFLT